MTPLKSQYSHLKRMKWWQAPSAFVFLKASLKPSLKISYPSLTNVTPFKEWSAVPTWESFALLWSSNKSLMTMIWRGHAPSVSNIWHFLALSLCHDTLFSIDYVSVLWVAVSAAYTVQLTMCDTWSCRHHCQKQRQKTCCSPHDDV